MIKLVCTDIDGTLVPDGTDKINPEIFDVILELKEKGIMFVAASGRQYASMKDLFLPVAKDMIFISEGGNLVTCREEIMAISKMKKEDVEKAIRDIESIPNCEALASGASVSYAKEGSEELIDLMTNGYHYNLEVVSDLLSVVDKDIIKVSMFQKDGRADEILENYMKEQWKDQDRIELICAGKEWIDCINRGSNKGTAIKQIQELMKISPQETMVFGDNLNDLHMMARAKYSFAVKNARSEVKEAANFIADTNLNDGVLKELKKLLKA
ncbi:MAG: HAD family hydrolase [Acetivibrio sp.]